MSRDKALPEHVSEELGRRGITIVGSGYQSGHGMVEFMGPNGVGRFKWSWPRGNGASDPRAMKNNRSQLRHRLRDIYGDEQ